LRDADSTSWYWEETGAEITDFYWAKDNPSMNADLVKSCIDFNYFYGGWDDDEREIFFYDVLCEEKL